MDSAPCRIAITCGEPAGIGAEAALKALAAGLPGGARPTLVGPRRVWEAAAAAAGVAADGPAWELVETGPTAAPDWAWGRPTAGSGAVAAQAVEKACELCLSGRCEAMVTAPLTKEGLALAGRPFPGHTELLEALCGGGHRATMMLAGRRLRVVLVTTHLPLARVPAAITAERVLATLVATHRGLTDDLGVGSPRIAVCGLNPHAGEGGLLGPEEEREIRPAVAEARRLGLRVEGPFAADSLFHRAAAGGPDGVDAVVAMYHDQGLGPLKLLHFHDGVNVTLGLPVVRTSPDHGTAFDLAGTGRAREESFREALSWAWEIATRRRERGLG